MSLEKPARRHDRTLLINDNEYSSLVNLIEKSNGAALVMATVQLWFSEKPYHKDWQKAHTGIICFVKDYSKKSYYFRMFNLPPRQLWEQEMYTPFSYIKISDNFHYFPADDCNAGLNFAKVEEAEKFLDTISSKIQSKSTKKKNLVKNQENIMGGIPLTNRMVLSSQPIILNTNAQMLPQSNRDQETSKYNTIKSKKNKKIDKSQISNPTGFRVVQHVGLSTNNNFEISLSSEDNTSKKMEEILQSINCPVNKKTTKFVNNYIKTHGGIEKFDEELKKQSESTAVRHPPLHPSQPPKVINQAPLRPPPGLPNRGPNSANVAPPPPPPLPQTLPPSIQQSSSVPPPTPPLPTKKNISTNSSQPPPPPPLPSIPPESQTNQTRGPVPAPPAPPPPPPPPPSLSDLIPSPLVIDKKSNNSLQQNQIVDSRDELLESIRGFQGFQNKSSNRNRISDPAPADNNPPSVLDQLKNELIKRAQFLNDSSDEGSDDESDSEWNS